MNKNLKSVCNFLLILLASVLMALNIKIFVNTAGLLPGGFTGITVLIQDIFDSFFGIKIPYSLFYWILNLIPAIFCFKFVGKRFTILSFLMIICSGLLTDFIPGKVLTDDILLCSVFGGITNGIAICLCLFAGATSGGTDFISIYFAEKKGFSIWNYIFAGNCVILVIFGLLFGWSKALYSIIFQFASTQVINMLYKRYHKTTILIISEKTEELVALIKATTNHDATIFKGIGGYEGVERTMIYTVVSTDQEEKLFHAIKNLDPNAFVNVLETKTLRGKFYMKKL